jgi:hypothetical protein
MRAQLLKQFGGPDNFELIESAESPNEVCGCVGAREYQEELTIGGVR